MSRFRYQDEHGEADPVYAKASTIERAREKLAVKWADYFTRINQDGRHDSIKEFKPDLVRLVGSEDSRYGPRPTCCDKIRQICKLRHTPLLYLEVDYAYSKGSDPKEKGPHAPRWMMSSTKVKFCPFCGTKLPKVELDPKPPQPLCVVTDGGYYCDTCKERLNACECNHPAAGYRIKR